MSLIDAVLERPGLRDLPVLEVLPELAQSLRSSPLAVLEAPPGSGKTILAPLWLAEKAGYRRVLVLVPRRVNARLPVLFLEPTCGQAVGYRIRFESRWTESHIKVGYLTYGTALRSFADAPPRSDDLVIFDELHERPWEADLLLAHLRRRAGGEGPSILLMSATLDSQALPAGTPRVRSDGRLHPVSVSREKVEPNLLSRPQQIGDLIARRSLELARDHPGEQLIFLPGISTIRSVEVALRADSLPGDVDVLHSSLPEAEIRRVVERPRSEGFRRILSTDLAESSVTLPGVTTVIDGGLQRRPRRDPFGLGITLETVRAPLSSLTQRAGRAGRLGPGHCHRLLTHQDELNRDGFGRPEITDIDSKTLGLHLAALGNLAHWEHLDWLTPPHTASLEKAIDWLRQHNLLAGDRLNDRGLTVLGSACTPRAGLLGLLASEAAWPAPEVVDWVYAAETGPWRDASQSLSLSDLLANKAYMGAREQRLLARLRDTFTGKACRTGASSPLLGAYSDTLVELRGDRALPRDPAAEALLYRNNHAAESRYAVLLGSAPAGREGPDSMVTLYQPVPTETVWEEMIDEMEESHRLEWDSRSRSVKEVRRTTLGALLIEEETVSPQTGPEVAAILRKNLGLADFGEAYEILNRRLDLFFQARAEIADEIRTSLPDPEDDITAGLLSSYLQTVTRWGKTSADDLVEHIKQRLGYQTMRALDSALPTSLTLPGRQRPTTVHYPQQGSPYVASKLQDFFGWKPPVLLDGRLRLACHLLAPNGRPAQITEDLAGFWKGSYSQVRKDLRGRYPRHAWPENP